MRTRRFARAGTLGAVALALLLGPWTAPAPAAADPVPVVSPAISGTARTGERLTADPGEWAPEPVTTRYRWFRSGRPIADADARRYRVQPKDVGHPLTVRVRVVDADGGTGEAFSEPTSPVDRGVIGTKQRPRVKGDARFGRTLKAARGRWSERGVTRTVRWLRDGKRIGGTAATKWSRAIAPKDVGRRLSARVTVRKPGYATRQVETRPVRARHRVGVRRTVTYSVTTRGHVTANLAEFRAQAQATYDDPRGWRGAGVEFRPVASGGSFTLVLAEASTLPSFSPVCSVQWSCRVGRFVVINQTRWENASPAWNAGPLSRRDYRHMVVNHETGHWLGRGHASCPGPGRPAPVMMQQSKGRGACSFNPWPTLGELGVSGAVAPSARVPHAIAD